MTGYNQFIIPRENIIEVDEEFHPFNELEKKVDNSSSAKQNTFTQSDLDEIDIFKQKISELKNEITFLERTKQTLENNLKVEEERKSALVSEKQKMQQEASDQASEIINKAKKQSEEIITEAQKNEEVLLNEANKSKQEAIDTGRKLGYKDGFQKGYDKGENDREEIEIYLKKILAEAIRKKDQVVESVREHLVDFVFTAVKKVVKNIIETDHKVVLRNIVDTLRQIDAPAKLIIKVSYDDLKTSKTLKTHILNSFRTLKQVEVLADPNIAKGGCIVETDFTIVDARISTQLEKIGNALNSLELVNRKK